MSMRHMIILTIISLLLIGNGCFLQPVAIKEKKFYFIELKDAPALRLLEPVKARCARKNPETGEWEDIGWGVLHPGGLYKGSKPEDVLKEEDDG